MKIFAATAALVVALAGSLLPAAARDTYVQDGASLLKPATVESLNRTIDDFHRQYGKEVVIVTVPSLDGQTILAVAEKQFAQQQVNGVLLLFAKAEQKDGVFPDRAGRRFFAAGTVRDIKDAMQGYLRSGNFDQGVTTGTNLIIDTYRSHARPANVRAYQSSPATNAASTGGFQMGWLWLIALLVVGFLIVRAIYRAIAGPRMVPPGYGGGQMGGPPGYGGGGMGGGGMGGGGFFSGLLGGLGGAFIGNELFGNRDRGFGGGEAGMGGDNNGGNDNSGFQNDAGQIDTGNSSSGDYGGGGGGWGDSGGGGGGFDGGGGGGDGGGGGW